MKKNYNILYYCWDEITSSDLISSLKKLGHYVSKFDYPIKDKLNDKNFADVLTEKIHNETYDFIFTFNFFPIISKVAEENNLKYVSWVYDSPHLTLQANSVFNKCNYIFHFDYNDVTYLQSIGVPRIYHMPLAINVDKYSKFKANNVSYDYDISFLGSLYNDQYNFYDQIQNIPSYYRGYFDCIINAQMNLFGYDLVRQLITENYGPIINSFVNFNLDKELFLTDTDMFISILKTKITNVERITILKALSEIGFNVTHFGPATDSSLNKVDFRGYVDFDTQMPQIFNRSKVNLNITLRSITSGIPLRCLDIMGCGGFLLSNYQPELAEYFENGKDMVMYESHEDLAEKAEYYLCHDEERILIAHNGQQKVFENFSYDNQLKKIFDIVFE